MTTEEFSYGFDTLVHSYTRFRDFDKREPDDTIEFDEYEKSIFLTKAQEEIVLSLYTGRNSSGHSFEETEELRRYLSDLIAEETLTPVDSSATGVESYSKFFYLPTNLWFITYEAASVTDGTCGEATLDVVPVTQDEYHKIKRNPFRGASGRRALRLDLSDNRVEIVSKNDVSKYYVRYLKKITPIVLENLPNGLEIGGISNRTPCMLHESIHQRILELGVDMALRSKSNGGKASQELAR